MIISYIPYIKAHTKFSFSFSSVRQLVFLFLARFLLLLFKEKVEDFLLWHTSYRLQGYSVDPTEKQQSDGIKRSRERANQRKENSHFHMRVLCINIISAFSTFSHFVPLSRLRSFQIYFLLFFHLPRRRLAVRCVVHRNHEEFEKNFCEYSYIP